VAIVVVGASLDISLPAERCSALTGAHVSAQSICLDAITARPLRAVGACATDQRRRVPLWRQPTVTPYPAATSSALIEAPGLDTAVGTAAPHA
jgi:hypothetical protein